MSTGVRGTTDDLRTQRFYHGTRVQRKAGDLIEPRHPDDLGERGKTTTCVSMTPNLDAAI